MSSRNLTDTAIDGCTNLCGRTTATRFGGRCRRLPSTIGPITLEVKQTGERSAGNPHAAFDVAGAGNVAWSRYCDTRKRKSEPTVNTSFDLNRRASPRPYLGEPGGESPGSGRQGCKSGR